MKSNWLGNIPFEHRHFVKPKSELEVASIVAKAYQLGEKVRVVGAGHSWTPACVSKDYLLNLDELSGVYSIDSDKLVARVGAGSRLKHLNHEFWNRGFALTNLGSIAEQSIAGATSTATHGSGIRFGNLSSAIVSVKLVDGKGQVKFFSKDKNPEIFAAFPVAFGCLGILTEIELKISPRYYLQEHRRPMDFDSALKQLPQLMEQCDHLKLWWFPFNKTLQTYSITRHNQPVPSPKSFNLLREDSSFAQGVFNLLLKIGNNRSLVPSINRFITSVQFKNETNVGRNFDVFNMVMPPKHHESEYAIPVEFTLPALNELRELIHSKKHPVNFITEVRFVKADDNWLSPAYGKDVCYIGGYMSGDQGWPEFLSDYEDLMLKYQGRPHWGKEFTPEKQNFPLSYPRWQDFLAIKRELDPTNTFSNSWTDRLFS
ncbi:MAG: FAD-binding protein [Bacteroidia bacterium]|nr:FAD-binding protein [Bacteroidia bacterium]